VLHLAGLDAGVEQQVVDEVLRRGVLGVDDGPALEVAHRGDLGADHDAVAAVGPVDLLVDAGRGARVLHQLGSEERHHVEGAPQDVAVASRVRVAGRDRVVDKLQVHLEAVLLVEDALGAGREAVVRGDDGQPADPDVDGELHHLVGIPLVGAGPLDGRQLLSGNVLVLGHRGDAGGIHCLGAALLLAELVHVNGSAAVPAGEDGVPEEPAGSSQTAQDEQHDHDLAQRGGPDFLRRHANLLVFR